MQLAAQMARAGGDDGGGSTAPTPVTKSADTEGSGARDAWFLVWAWCRVGVKSNRGGKQRSGWPGWRAVADPIGSEVFYNDYARHRIGLNRAEHLVALIRASICAIATRSWPSTTPPATSWRGVWVAASTVVRGLSRGPADRCAG
jgi:hypothetical protein